jgi:cell division protein FtsL
MQSLESARQMLSKCEASSLVVIALAMAIAMALFKSHTLDLDMDIHRKDFPIDDA